MVAKVLERHIHNPSVNVAGMHIWFTVLVTVYLSEYRRGHDNAWRVTRGIVHTSLSVYIEFVNKH
jgi:hypothetical protein